MIDKCKYLALIDEQDTDHGWGPTLQEAVQDLKEMYSYKDITDAEIEVYKRVKYP